MAVQCACVTWPKFNVPLDVLAHKFTGDSVYGIPPFVMQMAGLLLVVGCGHVCAFEAGVHALVDVLG